MAWVLSLLLLLLLPWRKQLQVVVVARLLLFPLLLLLLSQLLKKPPLLVVVVVVTTVLRLQQLLSVPAIEHLELLVSPTTSWQIVACVLDLFGPTVSFLHRTSTLTSLTHATNHTRTSSVILVLVSLWVHGSTLFVSAPPPLPSSHNGRRRRDLVRAT